MHRINDQQVLSRLRRGLPILGGLAVIVLLIAFAAGVRFAGGGEDESEDTAAEQQEAAASTDLTPVETTAEASTTGATVTTTAPSTVAVVQPTYGGEINVGVVGSPDSLNPLLGGRDRALEAFRWLTWASAVELDSETLEPVPGVVEEVPTLGNGGLTINEDGSMTVRYTIRGDAVWEDGTKVSFDDFLRTYEVATQAAGIHPDVEELYGLIVPDSVTGEGADVQFILERQTLRFVDLFDVLVPAHQVTVNGFSTAWDDRLWFSGGPFRFVSRQDNEVVLAANGAAGVTDEEGHALPYLEGLLLRFYRTDTEAGEALLAGEVDVAGTLQDPGLVEQIDDRADLDVDVRYGPEWEHITFQFGDGRFAANPDSTIDDVAVRREIATHIDRQSLAEQILGRFGRSLDSMSGLSWPAVDTGAWSIYDEPPSTDPCCEGTVVRYVTSSGNPVRATIARHLVEQLDPVGVRVEVEFHELGLLFAEYVIPGEYELAQWAWDATLGPGGAAGDLIDRYTVLPGEGNNFARWATGSELSEAEAEYVALVDGLDSVLSFSDLSERVNRIEQILADQVVVIPLFATLNVGAYDTGAVGGFEHAAFLSGGVTSHAAEWWVPR